MADSYSEGEKLVIGGENIVENGEGKGVDGNVKHELEENTVSEDGVSKDSKTHRLSEPESDDNKRIKLENDNSNCDEKNGDEVNGNDENGNDENGNGVVEAEVNAKVNATDGGDSDQDGVAVVPPVQPQLFYTPLKTGLVYDVRMRYHAKIFTSYFEYIDPHPEDPRRIYRIYKKLAEAGLIQDTSLSGADNIGPLMLKIPVREATAEEILEVHSEDHLRFISLTESMSRDRLLEETERGDSIYVNNDSYLSAKLSCGGSIEACKAVIEGRVKNSMAVVRPPGHHAEPETPGGFCLFSNVAVAAKNMLKLYPESVRKIVIVDWDIHHGNGTQKAFLNDPRVLYISLHRYENGRFYPGTKAGSLHMVGEGTGEGYNVNIPWSAPGTGDGDYIYAFNKVVIPIISEFDPDLLIVSSGFDAADGDIIGGCHVSPAGYGYMTHMLKAIARGKMSVILEGGYNLDSISKSALGVAKVLIGEPPESTITAQPLLDTIETIDDVIKVQSKYWNCLKPGNPTKLFDDVFDLPENTNGYKLGNISDPIRSFQANELFNNYKFVNLPIVASEAENLNPFTTDLPPHLEDLIVASPDINSCPIIIVTVHDPPEVWANINPINGNIEGNSSVVLDHPLVQIIERIKKEQEADEDIDQKIGYIDINIPSFSLPVAKTGSLALNHQSTAPASAYNPNIFSQELMLYIWDNYLSYFSQLKKMVFVGYGDAYQSIVHLYAKRSSQEIKDLVKGTVVYVNRSNLKPLVPVMDESMVDWFYQNSVIFTSCLNPCWISSNSNGTTNSSASVTRNGINGSSTHTVNNEDLIKRPRRKFGRVIKANNDGLWEVICERFDEGVDFILDSIEDYSSSSSQSN